MSVEPTGHYQPDDLPTAEPIPEGPTLSGDKSPVHRVGVSADAPPGYELREEIGRGGMGVVYRARDIRLNRDVAVKLLQNQYPANSHAARRFLAEAQITGQLQHPGIPPVHQVGELPNGRPFLAMKLIKGRTLAELLTDDSVSRGSLIAVFEQVCQAVAYAHNHGVIHRDLKPANIMVGAFGEVQVMDWGLAKETRNAERGTRSENQEPTESSAPHSALSTPHSDRTQAGAVLGTPAYMAPEQASGDTDRVDQRSDVFGLGAVLCVILTGQPPFRGRTAESTRQLAAQKQVNDAFSRLDACGAEPDLVALCKRCLDPERDTRARSASIVAKAVQTFRADAEERAKQAELDRVRAEGERAKAEVQATEQRKRRKVQLALAAAVLVLASAGGAFAWWQERKEEQAKLKQAEFEGEKKAEQRRFDAERTLKAEQARERGTKLLAFAAEAREEYRFAVAERALSEAAELAAKLAPELQPAVEQAKFDLAFVRELDTIRMKRAMLNRHGVPGGFEDASSPSAYRTAFASRGFDVVADSGAAGQRVLGSAVRAELVTALDDWAVLEPNPAVRDKVLAVLRRADPNPAAAPLRDPAVWADPARLEEQAMTADIAQLTPGTVVAIAVVMLRKGLNPAPLLRHAISLHPRDFMLAFALGQALPVSDPEKVGAYRAARAIRPDNVTLLLNLGVCLQRQGDLDGAHAAFQQAVALEPDLAFAHNSVGTALYDKQDLDGAIAAFRRAIALDPKYAMGFSNLGSALRDKGDLDGAIAACRRAIALDPTFLLGHINLGDVLKDRNDLDGAIAAYREAIRRDPRYANGYNSLGIALRARKDLPGAIAAYKEAIRLDPTFEAPRTNLGNAYLLSGQFDGAISAYRDAIRCNPTSVRAHTSLGDAHKAKGEWREAISAYKQAIRLNPRFAHAHSCLAEALLATDDLDAAIAAFKEAIKCDPNSPQSHHGLGLALSMKGDLEAAIVAYKQSLALRPGNANTLANLGGVYYELKRYPEALVYAQATIKADPRSGVGYAFLGSVLQATGDISGARAALTEAARLDRQQFEPWLKKLPPIPVAPSPREGKGP